MRSGERERAKDRLNNANTRLVNDLFAVKSCVKTCVYVFFLSLQNSRSGQYTC